MDEERANKDNPYTTHSDGKGERDDHKIEEAFQEDEEDNINATTLQEHMNMMQENDRHGDQEAYDN